MDEEALLAAATDNDKRTEARAYLGLALALAGRPEQARPHLHWVRDHGNRTFIEYDISRAELARLDDEGARVAQP